LVLMEESGSRHRPLSKQSQLRDALKPWTSAISTRPLSLRFLIHSICELTVLQIQVRFHTTRHLLAWFQPPTSLT
jgi:hypothetical protein